jgi:hypothetical protein
MGGRRAGSCRTEQSSYSVSSFVTLLIGSHKRRDKRCHIAAPLLRSALHVVLAKHHIAIDETGQSLAYLGTPLEGVVDRRAEIAKRKSVIEGVTGEGGEIGIFNINHLGGHRYAGVMLVSHYRI